MTTAHITCRGRIKFLQFIFMNAVDTNLFHSAIHDSFINHVVRDNLGANQDFGSRRVGSSVCPATQKVQIESSHRRPRRALGPDRYCAAWVSLQRDPNANRAGAVPSLRLFHPAVIEAKEFSLSIMRRKTKSGRLDPAGSCGTARLGAAPPEFGAAPRRFAGSNGNTGMVDYHGRFAWYELMTTDVAAATAFYADVVGWSVQDASTPDLAYSFFNAGKTPVSGVMDLPEEARRMGATPRWMGYVGVNDVDVAADRLKRLGGAVYVPPTDSNIGRISVVADPQTATLALLKGSKPRRQQVGELGNTGHVGWHELRAADGNKVFAFYGELFGWQKADAEIGPTDTYQLFSAGGQTIGGMFTKPAQEPVPYWLFYFNVGDIDAAAERVKSGGGQIFEGPVELPGGSWIARCVDPQGAAFALQGKQRQDGIGWTTEWDGFSSKGRLLGSTKPRA
jgi:uncharacterized protein